MKIRLLISCIVAVCISLPVQVSAMGADIVAIVGDDAISSLDVNRRVELAIKSSGLKSSEEVRQQIFPQVIRILIDEKLYEQEAARLSISVVEQDVREALMSLEERNNIKYGTFKDFIKSKGIPVEPAMEQLKAQILWNKIVARKIRPEIVITGGEIEEKLEHIASSSGRSDIDISEIVLPVDSPKDEKHVKKLAKKLVDEIRGGADFTSIAKEFSRSSSASSGGELGWMREESSSDEFFAKVANLRNGEVSEPFKKGDSYYILKLNGRRAIVDGPPETDDISMKQAFVLLDGADDNKIRSIAKDIGEKSSKVKSCKAFDEFAKSIESKVDSALIKTKLSALNPSVAKELSSLEVNQISGAIKGPDGFYVFMVCGKSKPTTSVVSKEKVEELLLRRQLDLQAQRYLRELRNSAFIEIRA